jgi:hypothetical protein
MKFQFSRATRDVFARRRADVIGVAGRESTADPFDRRIQVHGQLGRELYCISCPNRHGK